MATLNGTMTRDTETDKDGKTREVYQFFENVTENGKAVVRIHKLNRARGTRVTEIPAEIVKALTGR